MELCTINNFNPAVSFCRNMGFETNWLITKTTSLENVEKFRKLERFPAAKIINETTGKPVESRILTQLRRKHKKLKTTIESRSLSRTKSYKQLFLLLQKQTQSSNNHEVNKVLQNYKNI